MIERKMITNEDIYELCQEILSTVRDYGDRQIANQYDLARKLDEIKNAIDNVSKMLIDKLNLLDRKLDELYEGIKTLSDNQVVIYEKLEVIHSLVDQIRNIANELRAVLPGV